MTSVIVSFNLEPIVASDFFLETVGDFGELFIFKPGQ